MLTEQQQPGRVGGSPTVGVSLHTANMSAYTKWSTDDSVVSSDKPGNTLSNWNCPGLRLPHVRQHLKWLQHDEMLIPTTPDKNTWLHGYSVLHPYRDFPLKRIIRMGNLLKSMSLNRVSTCETAQVRFHQENLELQRPYQTPKAEYQKHSKTMS